MTRTAGKGNQNQGRPQQPVCLITRVSDEFGGKIAQQLAKLGPIALNDCQDGKAAKKIASEIERDGGEAAVFEFDLKEPRMVSDLVKKVTHTFGHPSILINNAGITPEKLPNRMTREDLDSVLGSNFLSPYDISQAVLEGMSRQQWGRIINISSILNRWANGDQPNYSSAKLALDTLESITRSTAFEYAIFGITVNSILPIYKSSHKRDHKNDGLPALVKFLASPEADLITGLTIPLDGGLSLGSLR